MTRSEIKAGDIVEISLFFADKPAEKKRRTALVIDTIKDDVIVAFVTSNLKYDGVILEEDSLESGRLKNKSVVRVEKLNYISKKECRYIGTLKSESFKRVLKGIQFYFTTSYYKSIHQPSQSSEFIPGKSKINYAGRVFDEKEMINLVDSSLDFWLTAGKYAGKFEKEFAEFLGVKYCSLTNSGSSANLLAVSALTSPKLGERRLKQGDEVITTACAFPTTVNPIIQNNLIPVFIDVDVGTYNIQADKIEEALSEKTKAIFLAHTLGNPFDLDKVLEICEKYNLWLMEDNCDALGSKYKGRYTGTFGHIATFSFYPPHHITMGEGGALVTNDAQLKRLIESFRDWGRDCWCEPGKDNTCGKRFEWQLGSLPYGYDHKYIYSHFGYNLKVTDMQAATGCAQLEKLPAFIEARKKNWRLLRDGLSDLSDRFILPEPTPVSDPSWFGFLLTVREDDGFTRDEIVGYLESKGIQTRMLFAGNIIKHPCFDEMRKSGQGFRVVGTPSHLLPLAPSHAHTLTPSALPITDRVMRDTFWVGVYPGMREEMVEYMIEQIREFVNR